jgi:XTP/dITP diphosphohydrolase
MKICFATHNQNKLEEVILLLSHMDVVGLEELGQLEEIPETGSTLDENSALKAKFVWDKFNVNCFADDTGLEVEALNRAPGVITARYAGDERDNEANINLLLKNLVGQSNRKAQFRTIITLIINDSQTQFEGVVNGEIVESLSGTKGFGYDPIFKPNGYDLTFAEMSMKEKSAISHRGRAIKKLVHFLSDQ